MEGVEPVVGQIDAIWQLGTLSLAGEDFIPFQRFRRERLLVAVQKTIKRSVPRNDGPLKCGDGHGNAFPGHVGVAEDLGKLRHVFRHGADLLFHEIEILVHLEGRHHRKQRLFLKG